AIPAWEDMTYNELKAAAKEAGIKGYGKMSKAELIEALKAKAGQMTIEQVPLPYQAEVISILNNGIGENES
ncbi:MAG: Rho termination factor N-terminal domain-containing protein, partial [Peptococcales bacterium]